MLKPPHNRYRRIFVYHLDRPDLPPIDDPDLIGAWREGETTVLFFHRANEELVAEICGRNDCSVVYAADMDYRDWENGSEIFPFNVGPLRIAPVWDAAVGDIVLDPSVIFGNGFHPTTRLCLESLVDLSDEREGLGTTLDLGCGTGILGIAAARLGINNVVAVDENNLAVQVARANIVRNGAENQVRVMQQDLSVTSPSTKNVDLVMANLFHDLLASLFNNPAFWQPRYYIISGFFTAREEELLPCLPLEHLTILNRTIRDKWGCWVMARKEQHCFNCCPAR
jgi:ribosomal protein L11 methyltransferase